jgi:regulator of sirC expression with transglutaminase-like and TPR domain
MSKAALISLLEETDSEIFRSVEAEFLVIGIEAIPLLEKKWEEIDNEVIQTRIVNLIHKIQFNSVKSQLKFWASEGGSDLFFGAFLVAKYHFPNLSYNLLNEMMNIIRRDIWFEINDQQSTLEKIRAFNRIFFGQYRFQRHTTDFFHINNCLINSVIESKRGNDISLSILYMVLCQRLGLPVYGVNLPMNFILAFMNMQTGPITIKNNPKNISNIDLSKTDVLFYINPLIDGVVLSKRDIDNFLADQNLEYNSNYYRPTTNIQIINVLLSNLESCYDLDNSIANVNEIHELSKLLI